MHKDLNNVPACFCIIPDFINSESNMANTVRFLIQHKHSLQVVAFIGRDMMGLMEFSILSEALA